jgi:hypothetical protein
MQLPTCSQPRHQHAGQYTGTGQLCGDVYSAVKDVKHTPAAFFGIDPAGHQTGVNGLAQNAVHSCNLSKIKSRLKKSRILLPNFYELILSIDKGVCQEL